MKTVIFAAIAAATIGAASAQTNGTAAPQTPPPPPCQADIYHAFDFWLGDWSVTAGGQVAGENSITAHEGGCLLIENWTGAGGSTGQSYNFYDPGADKWRQLWVSGGSVIDYSGGLDDSGAMVLNGEIAYRNGKTFPFKGTWTLLEDGTVKQHFQQYNPEKDEWADWFVGIYTKTQTAE